MDAIANLIQNLEISKGSFLGKRFNKRERLSTKGRIIFKEQNFEQKIEFSYYVGKCCMCLSFQVEYFPSHEDVLKLAVLTEKHFVQEKN